MVMRTLIVCLIVCLLLITGLAACAQPAPRPSVQLLDLQPLPPAPAQATVPLRVAVAAIISPQGNAQGYGQLLEYLGRRLDRPVEMVQRRTYIEVNDLVRDGQVDLAFVCTSAYITGARDFDMQLLVAPQVNGQSVYHSDLIVAADSPAASMADLQGKIFAFTDPISFSGRVYPTHLVAQLGTTPAEFFGRTFFTYSHDDAIRAVADGVADAAAVDSLVFDFAVARDPALARRVKVIHQSPPFGIPPVVVGAHVRPQLRASLYDLLLTMHGDESGRQALQAVGFDRFVPIEPQAYDSARSLIFSDQGSP